MARVEITYSKLARIGAAVSLLVLKKNADYQDSWQRQGLGGCLVRLADKFFRVENVNGKEALITNETVAKTLIDAIGYSMLGLVYIMENDPEQFDEALKEVGYDVREV